MTVDATQYAHECRFCQLRKHDTRRAKIPIQQYDMMNTPFWRCHMDLAGPFPTSAGGYKYILVFKDALTRYVEIVPLAKKDALHAATAFYNHVIMRHGTPRLLITDRGTEFYNQLAGEVARLFNFRHVCITPANPRADGAVENYMKDLKIALTAYCNKFHTDWDKHLMQIAYMHNTTVSYATGYTPYMLLHGREAAGVDVDHFDKVIAASEFVENVRTVMQYIWEHVGMETMKKVDVYNRRPVAPLQFKKYKVGEFFYHKKVPRRFYKDDAEDARYKLASKLQFIYSGPFVILKEISPVVYEAMIHGEVKRVHAINMNPAR